MFVKGIRRNYDKINADESIADEDKIDALLKALGKDYLIASFLNVCLFTTEWTFKVRPINRTTCTF